MSAQTAICVNSLVNFDNYGIYSKLVKEGFMNVDTGIINRDNISVHFKWILNAFRDGIEQDSVHNMKLAVTFQDGVKVNLSIFDYFINLIMWKLPLSVDDPLTSEFLFFEEDITGSNIKKYIDDKFLDKHRTTIPNITLNQIIDNCLYDYKYINEFALYFLNTINNEDTIALMESNPEFDSYLHADLSGVPIEDVKSVGMDITRKVIDVIKHSDHCLRDSFRAKEGISDKQFREFMVNIGSKPDGSGGVYPAIINSSYSNEGLSDVESYFMDSATGRIALMMQKNNVGDSGHFSRILGLNNEQSRIHPDPHYVCNTKNLIKVTIDSSDKLNRYKNRYYRLKPNGVDKKLSSNPVKDNIDLMGQTLYFRSPMTCASAARGEGVCYACYGSLAYVNADINIGKIAAELLCSVLTQMLLSAKHLLESLVKAIKWTDGFLDLFDVAFNIIGIKEDLENVKKYKLIIEDIHDDSDADGMYINYFNVQYPDGSIKTFRTENDDNIYLSEELQSMVDDPEEGLTIPFDALNDCCLFLVKIYNNEMSKILENVKTTIDRIDKVKDKTKDEWLEDFLNAIIAGGITLDAVHAEMILSNQIRSADDVLELPRWEYPNETYRLLTLNEALTNHPCVTASIEYQKLPRALYYPLSFKKYKACSLDLFFMEKPQDFMETETTKSTIKKEEEHSRFAFSFTGMERAFGYVDEEE